MKIGYLLLSGDPIHIGHISMCSKCLNEGILDYVYIVPCVQNPWKDMPFGTFEERCEMIRNACRYIDRCELDDVEKDLFPPYYSCNTLDALYKKHDGDNNELYILGGTDTVDSLSSWMNYETMIKGRFKVVAFTRQNQKPQTEEVPYVLVESDVPDLSSTYVRNLIRDGKNVYPYIPESNIELCKRIYSDVDSDGFINFTIEE